MKHLTHITLLAVLCLAFAVAADAQVSVRRTPKKETTEKKDEGKGSKPAATTPAKPAAAAKPSDSAKPAAPKPAATTPAKPATSAKPAATPAKTTPTRTAPAAKTTPAKATPSAAAPLPEGKTLREQAFDDYQRREATNVPWQHVVYRELDLTKGSNASLYFPEEPTDGMTNLFRVIVELLASGQIKGYEYLDGREIFTEKYEVKVKDVFDKFQILYTEKAAAGRGAAPVLTVDDSDVPSNEVLSYFIKERWEYDYQTSHYGPRLLALCPVLHRSGDFGGDAVKYPMLWINYEDLRPYLRSHLIVSDGMNAAPRYTMEDFFALHQYSGDIYKVQNLRGLSLMQQYPDPDTLRMARARIEAQLRGFSDSIWVSTDEPEQAAASPRLARRGRDAAAVDSLDATATAAPSVPASSSAADGAKRNRRTKEAVDMEAVEAAEDAKAAQEDENIRRTGVARSVRRQR